MLAVDNNTTVTTGANQSDYSDNRSAEHRTSSDKGRVKKRNFPSGGGLKSQILKHGRNLSFLKIQLRFYRSQNFFIEFDFNQIILPNFGVN